MTGREIVFALVCSGALKVNPTNGHQLVLAVDARELAEKIDLILSRGSMIRFGTSPLPSPPITLPPLSPEMYTVHYPSSAVEYTYLSPAKRSKRLSSIICDDHA